MIYGHRQKIRFHLTTNYPTQSSFQGGTQKSGQKNATESSAPHRVRVIVGNQQHELETKPGHVAACRMSINGGHHAWNCAHKSHLVLQDSPGEYWDVHRFVFTKLAGADSRHQPVLYLQVVHRGGGDAHKKAYCKQHDLVATSMAMKGLDNTWQNMQEGHLPPHFCEIKPSQRCPQAAAMSNKSLSLTILESAVDILPRIAKQSSATSVLV
jgi:hypothetical protein